MGGAPLLLTLAALSIDYGVRPDGADGYQYVVQVDPDQLEEQIELESVVDPRIRGQVTSIVVRLSSGPLPKDVLDPGEVIGDRAVKPAVAYTNVGNANETQSRRPQSDAASGSGSQFTLPPRPAQDPPTANSSSGGSSPQAAAEPAPNSAPPTTQTEPSSSDWGRASQGQGSTPQRQSGGQGSADGQNRTISQGVANSDGTLTRQSARDSGQWRGFEEDPRVAQSDQRSSSTGTSGGRSDYSAPQSGYSSPAADSRANPDPRYASADPRAQNAADPYERSPAANPQYDGPLVTRPSASDPYRNPAYDRPADNSYSGGPYGQSAPAYGQSAPAYGQQPAPAYGQQPAYSQPPPSQSAYAAVPQTPAGASAGGSPVPSLPTVQAPVRDFASEAQLVSPLDRNNIRLAQREGEESLLANSRRSFRDDEQADSVPSSYQPFSQRALNGMLLISIVLNAFFLINILKLYHRHRDLVHNVRSSTPASS